MNAFGDPTRRAVYERLRSGPRSVGEIAAGLPVSRPAVSQHLRVLKEAGLVAERREGTKRIYELAPRARRAPRLLRAVLVSGARRLQGGGREEGRRQMMVDAEDLVIRKEIHVNVPVERAFEVFTAGLQDWWPMETHSLAKGGSRSTGGSAAWRSRRRAASGSNGPTCSSTTRPRRSGCAGASTPKNRLQS